MDCHPNSTQMGYVLFFASLRMTEERTADERQTAALHTMETALGRATVYRVTRSGEIAMGSGGGSGIGLAIALLSARLGANVVICGRTAEKRTRRAQFALSRGGPCRRS